jgi:hypothetical protein
MSSLCGGGGGSETRTRRSSRLENEDSGALGARSSPLCCLSSLIRRFTPVPRRGDARRHGSRCLIYTTHQAHCELLRRLEVCFMLEVRWPCARITVAQKNCRKARQRTHCTLVAHCASASLTAPTDSCPSRPPMVLSVGQLPAWPPFVAFCRSSDVVDVPLRSGGMHDLRRFLYAHARCRV